MSDDASRRTTLYVLVADASAERLDYRALLSDQQVYWGFVETKEVFAAALRLQPWDVVLIDSSMADSIPPDLLAAQDIGEDGHQIVLMVEPERLVSPDWGCMPDADLVLKRSNLWSVLSRILRRAVFFQKLRQDRSILEQEIERILSTWEISVRDRTRSLERKTQELETLSELKNQFLENVSHELRAPLTVIRSYVELLLECPPDDEQERREFMRIIDTETLTLSRMIDDLLDISRLSTGNMSWSMQELDVGSLVAQVLSQHQALLQREGVATNLFLPFELPRIWGDREKLLQVVGNILENSVREARGGVVTVKADLHSEENDGEMKEFVQVSIEDTGPGIPEDQLERIFERFTQSRSRQGSRGGTGLGLPIAREIVQHHGGRIWVENTNVGSKFCFTLPLAGHLDLISGVYDSPKD
jgi:signal transduction histidine kinase